MKQFKTWICLRSGAGGTAIFRVQVDVVKLSKGTEK
jgi:hypothetical protein